MPPGFTGICCRRWRGTVDSTAKAAFAEMMRNYPGLTVSRFKQAMVFSGPILERMAGHLRRLGLAE
jgi:adenylate cyclase